MKSPYRIGIEDGYQWAMEQDDLSKLPIPINNDDALINAIGISGVEKLFNTKPDKKEFETALTSYNSGFKKGVWKAKKERTK